MTYFIALSYLLLLLVVKTMIKDDISKRLFIIYTSYWCVSLFVSSAGWYDLYEVSDETYLLLLGHVFTFVFGFILIKPASVLKAERVQLDMSKLLHNKFFLVFFVYIFIYVINMFIRQRDLLAMYTLSQVRGDFWELVLEGGQFTFYTLVVTSMFHFSLCIAFYMLFFDRKWVYIAVFMSFSVFFALLGGGRNQFMKFLYYAIGMYILKDYIWSSLNKKITKFVIPTKMKVIILSIFIGSFIGMSIFTALRKGNGSVDMDSLEYGISEIGDVFVSYSIGPIVAFDKCLNGSRFKDRLFYGRASFNGTEQLLYKFGMKYIFPNYEPCYNEVTGYLQHNRINISNSRDWNYAYTSCFYYYCDFGKIGILLFPFLLGIVLRFLINSLEKRLNIYSIAMFQYLCYCMYMTVFSGYIFKTMTVAYIVLLLFLSYYFTKNTPLFHNSMLVKSLSNE